nr:MAG: hypothetical protein DIU56_14240 [Pseudomonadota bacterium]
MRTRVRVPVRVRGLTLIELMVALTIGSILVVGAVYVYSQSSATYRTILPTVRHRRSTLGEHGSPRSR